MILKTSVWLLLWITLFTPTRSLHSQSTGGKKHCRSTHRTHKEVPSVRGLFSPSFLESQRIPYDRNTMTTYESYEKPPRYIYPQWQFSFQGNPYVGNTHIVPPTFLPRVPSPPPLTQLSYRRTAVQPTEPLRDNYKKNFRDKLLQNIERLNQLEKERDDQQLVRAAAEERGIRTRPNQLEEEPIMVLKGISAEESNETSDQDMEKELVSSEVSLNRTRRSANHDTEIATFHPDKILVPEDIRRQAEAARPHVKIDESKYIPMAEVDKMFNVQKQPIKPLPVPVGELPPATINKSLPPHVHINEGDPIDLVSRKLFERPIERSNVTISLARSERSTDITDVTNLDKRTIKKDLSNFNNVTNSTSSSILDFNLFDLQLFGLKPFNYSENIIADA